MTLRQPLALLLLLLRRRLLLLLGWRRPIHLWDVSASVVLLAAHVYRNSCCGAQSEVIRAI